jgi:hypothetical protein
MDATRFDGLLRMFSTMPSRRGVTRTALGLALAGSLGGLFGAAPTGAKKGKKKKCKKPEPCICPTECSANADCPADSGKICESGSCVCPPNTFDSGGVCGTFPGCKGRAVSCAANGECCSNQCEGVTGCFCSTLGEPCIIDTDCCVADNATCRDFVCSIS